MFELESDVITDDKAQLENLQTLEYVSACSHSTYILPMLLAMMPSLIHIETSFGVSMNKYQTVFQII